MKVKFLIFLFFVLSISTAQSQKLNKKNSREEILLAAREIINAAGTCALITVDEKGLPHARTMDPFAPEPDFTIWLATNPQSRKVVQIQNNSNVILHYIDKNSNGYVSVYGKAFLVNDPHEKDKRWKEEWKSFYPNRDAGYLLIKLVPDRLEIINYARGINGNPQTWQPAEVNFN
jgi:general stress protein 26